MVRELPIRTQPLDDEPIESWLEAYAARLDISVATLARAIGLRSTTWLWARNIPATESRDIETATGVSSATLTTMTLTRYLEHIPGLDASDFTLTGWMERPLPGFRWCPDCLKDTGGRWQLRWRLPWTCACTTHQRLLVDVCPACGCRPKAKMMPIPGRIIRPGHCRETRDPDGRVARDAPCCHDLSTAPAPQLDFDDPLLAAQHQIDTLLASPPDSSAHSVGDPISVCEVLADAAILGNHILNSSPLGPPDGTRRSPTARHTAPMLTTVMAILACTNVEDAADRIRNAVILDAPRRAGASRVAQPPSWNRTSRRLKLALSRSRSPMLKPLDRLRLPVPTGPDGSHPANGDRYRKVPGQFWPSWTLRLMPPHGLAHRTYTTTLSTLLLLAGTGFMTRTQLPDDLATSDAFRCRLTDHVMRQLDHLGHATAVVTALTAIASRLDQNPAVIDYQRRRDLFSDHDQLLAARDWDAMCRQAGRPAGRQLHHAQRYLQDLLIGGTPAAFFACVANELAGLPDQQRLPARTPSSGSYRGFREPLPRPIVEQLHDHAGHLLADHGIEEPLTWEPPWDWAPTGLTWPGAHPDGTDTDRLHALVQQRKPITVIAAALSTTPQHIRLALRHNPLPAEERSSVPNQLKPRVGLLSAEHVRYRYQDCGWSWQQIADEAGCSKHTAMDIGRQSSITARPGGRPASITIDPDWLRTEYLDKRRTVPDLAAELGVSPQRVRDKARKFGIPLRARGGASHAAALHPSVATNACPQHLLAALQGQNAIERVRRFVMIVEQLSIARAARAVGTTQTALTSQLARLEADVGKQLIERARGNRPCKLTPAGRAFFKHARRILATVDEPRAT